MSKSFAVDLSPRAFRMTKTYGMPKKENHGGKRPGAGRPKGEETQSISVRFNKEALDICRNYYKDGFTKKINDYVKKLANKLAKFS